MSADRLRILSANLWNGRADPLAFAELLTAHEVDVCALQELSPEQAHAIARVLPHGKLEPDRFHQGMGIALRAPGELERLPLPARDARLVRLDPVHWPALDAPLEIGCFHVHAPHDGLPWRSFALRRRQVARACEHLAATRESARAWLGDWNSTPLWPAYRSLRAHLRDAALEVARRNGRAPARTWGPTARSPRLLRIDHAFVCGVEVLDARVVPIEGGDHSAVLVDLLSS